MLRYEKYKIMLQFLKEVFKRFLRLYVFLKNILHFSLLKLMNMILKFKIIFSELISTTINI